MNSPQRRINPELLLSISATFLSLAALVVSIFQTKIAREQQQASVWPYLQVLGANLDQEYHYGIENKGVGPAIIKQFGFRYRNKSYNDIRPLFWEAIGKDVRGDKSFGSITPNEVLKAGESFELLGVTKNDAAIAAVNKMITDSTFHLRITFADVYGNCWLLDGNKVTAMGKCSQ